MSSVLSLTLFLSRHLQLLHRWSLSYPPFRPVPCLRRLQINLYTLLPIVKPFMPITLAPCVKVWPWIVVPFHELPQHHVEARLASVTISFQSTRGHWHANSRQGIQQDAHTMRSMRCLHAWEITRRPMFRGMVVVVEGVFAEFVKAVDKVLAIIYGKILVWAVTCADSICLASGQRRSMQPYQTLQVCLRRSLDLFPS